MDKIFIYEKGDFLMQYQAKFIPRIGEVIIYQDYSYQILDIAYIVKKDVENGNYLTNIDIAVCCLD